MTGVEYREREYGSRDEAMHDTERSFFRCVDWFLDDGFTAQQIIDRVRDYAESEEE